MVASATTWTDSLLAPLDRARSSVFVRLARVAALRPVLLEKRRRVPAILLTHAFFALLLSVWSPTLLLIAGPLILGVPHLLADLRYLVLRPAFSNATRRVLLGGCGLLLLLRLLELAGLHDVSRLELSGAGLMTLAAISVGPTRASLARTVAVAAVTASLFAVSLRWPREARTLLSHGHNLVALVVWAVLFCGSRRRAFGVAAMLVAVALALVLTPLGWWGFQHGLRACGGLHAFAAADALAPGIRNTTLALGVLSSFAFLQSIHYAVWLHAIPQETTRGEGSLTFRMSYRALVSDFGRPTLAALTLLVLAVPALGFFAPLRTQATYLSLSSFHAYLELAVLALWCVRDGAPNAAGSARACC